MVPRSRKARLGLPRALPTAFERKKLAQSSFFLRKKARPLIERNDNCIVQSRDIRAVEGGRYFFGKAKRQLFVGRTINQLEPINIQDRVAVDSFRRKLNPKQQLFFDSLLKQFTETPAMSDFPGSFHPISPTYAMAADGQRLDLVGKEFITRQFDWTTYEKVGTERPATALQEAKLGAEFLGRRLRAPVPVLIEISGKRGTVYSKRVKGMALTGDNVKNLSLSQRRGILESVAKYLREADLKGMKLHDSIYRNFTIMPSGRAAYIDLDVFMVSMKPRGNRVRGTAHLSKFLDTAAEIGLVQNTVDLKHFFKAYNPKSWSYLMSKYPIDWIWRRARRYKPSNIRHTLRRRKVAKIRKKMEGKH